ncbi:putative ribonuclease H protein, partial [Trifolium medium]|nr:putative ribonuclease H protein [Trifolium medium]
MPFRFFKVWNADCARVVKDVWSKAVVGNPMLQLQLKLKRLKTALKTWNKTVFGNIDTNVKLANDEALLNQDQFWRKGTDNDMLTKVPSNDEIKASVFAMNGDGAPGPDGFSAHFYQFFWEIIALDVIRSVQHFFISGKLQDNINANLMILIPKTPGADRMEEFRPISKILAERLATWQVLKQFGFNSIFCDWILEILYSAKLSVLINGKAVGYFSCTHGVRQGDLLSPLLFCLAEEVLSRSLAIASSDNRIRPMHLCRAVAIPSHVLYADDIMIFCKGSKKNIRGVMQVLNDYGAASGQIVNKAKTKFYADSISNARLVNIAAPLGFNAGSIPFNYLGCPIFVGHPKAVHFQALADRIKTKLATWKGSLLSIMGRVQLVRSIIHGMLINSFHIYRWPKNILKKLDTWVRNFVWSGDVTTRKICTVSWIRVCTPYSNGGLDLRALSNINASLMLLLCWKLCSNNEQWAVMCRARFLRDGAPVRSSPRSSIWSGIKPYFDTVILNSMWIVGSGNQISYWKDNWLGVPLVEAMHIPLRAHKLLTARVSDLIEDFTWVIPTDIADFDSALVEKIMSTVIPRQPYDDR